MQKYVIKSVFNLRRERRTSPGYQQEVCVAEKLGIAYDTFRLFAVLNTVDAHYRVRLV
jgi:hypothetical protein